MTEALEPTSVKLISEIAARENRVEIVNVPTKGLARAGSMPAEVPVAIDRNSGIVSAIEAEIAKYRRYPERRRGTAKAFTVAAFIDMVNRHKYTDATAVFADALSATPKLLAVIDYHALDATPGWCQHRIGYEFPLTEEFKTWRGGAGTAMSQLEFAQFLEDHAAELAVATAEEREAFEGLFRDTFATPHELVGLSRDLEIHVGARVKRQERLKSGERIVQFDEAHVGSDGEPVRIPGLFMVSVPPFIDGNPIRVPARLRYRVRNGDLSWSYDLYRLDAHVQAAVRAEATAVADATGLPVYEGAPESA